MAKMLELVSMGNIHFYLLKLKKGFVLIGIEGKNIFLQKTFKTLGDLKDILSVEISKIINSRLPCRSREKSELHSPLLEKRNIF